MSTKIVPTELWPELPYDEIMPTVDHIHRLAQIGGKYTLYQPYQHCWGSIVLSVTPSGFATPALWYDGVTFVVEYDLLANQVNVTASTGKVSFPLAAGTVADFYAKFIAAVAKLGIGPLPTKNTLEKEIDDPKKLDEDHALRPYDPSVAHRMWAALASASRALNEYQSPYKGPRLPVGIMWGGFDLYAARFNGRDLTPPSKFEIFQQNGMCAETVAVGFYFGDSRISNPSFFAYITPTPDGIAKASFGVDGASFNAEHGLIVLPWETVRKTGDPHGTVVKFADAVYENAVKLGGWPPDLVGPRVDGWYASSHRV